MRPFVIGFFILVLTISSAQAQECSRVGAETCMNGAIYQCMEAQYFSSWARVRDAVADIDHIDGHGSLRRFIHFQLAGSAG